MIFLGRKLSILFIILCLFVSSKVNSAELSGELKGRVQTYNNEPIYAAHISIPALSRGVVSDEQGNFSIKNLPLGKHRVIISYIGYESVILFVEITSASTEQYEIKLKATLIETEQIVVTGNPYATDKLNSPQDVANLSGKEKLRMETTSLGKSLENISGVYNLSAGSVAGKPVIRGHTGERVLVLNDGISQEYQQYGERHSPTVDPFNFDRIEIIKGASSLLYGSDALGGAVNLIPHPFHFSQSSVLEFEGAVNSGYYSNNNEYFTGLKISSSINNLAFNGSIIRRKSDYFNTPDANPFAVSKKRGDPKFTGEIPFTNFEQFNFNLSLGYLLSFGIISIDYNNYLNENNFLLPDAKPIGIKLKNDVVNIKGNFPFANFIVKPKFSYQKNNRQATKAGLEYQNLPDSAAVDLILDVYSARIDVENVDILNLSGTFGLEIKYYDHENIGTVPLQPTGSFTNYALFIFEEWRKNNFIVNLGGRFDHRTQTFFGTTTNPLLKADDSRTYSNFSSSLGIAYKITENFTVSGNYSRGFRTPSFFNLYVYGEHGGVFAFQIGNKDLKNEISSDINLSLRYRNDFLNTSLTGFANSINNYIFLYNAPDHPLAPANKPFVFAHDQADASMKGIEFSLDLAITDWLVLLSSYSMIESEFKSGVNSGGELPLMPPDRLTFGIKFQLPNLSLVHNPFIAFSGKVISSKKAAGIYEPFGQFDDGIGPDIPFGVCSTEGYEVFDLNVGFDLYLYNSPVYFDISVSNLFDKVYRDFLDTYKGYALAQGSSYNFKINIPFSSGI